MADLLERAAELEALEEAFAQVAASGAGAVAVVAGEAGIGKTSLLREFCARGDGAAVLWGGCDPLFTPRPLAPFLEIAEGVGGTIAERVAGGAAAGDLVSALADELQRRAPAVLVVEDLHWADEATLDVARLLVRRVASLPALLVLTYRDDSIDRTHPLRRALGELSSRARVVRLPLSPLSVGAVAALAGPGVDPQPLAERTGGNPFFVTEVLAAAGASLPETVRDAVLARAARLGGPARGLLDAVSIVPPRAELWLLEAIARSYPDGLEECLASGMLRSEGDAVAFRHEIARVAVEEALPPHERLALHRAALAALEAGPQARDPARLAHHAEGAGDSEAVLAYAPVAAERAAALGAHREAAQQFARALREADALPPRRRAELYERRSYECYLTDQIREAVEARRSALEEHRRLGDRLREGDSHRWLSRLHWFLAENESAEREAREAVALLEPLPPGPELAMAWSNVAQLRMLANDTPAAVEWGTRAIELAERLGAVEILAHALNNVGTAEYQTGDEAGRAKLERSLELALEAGLEEHAARAWTNLGAEAVDRRDYRRADAALDAGLAFCREHDLDAWLLYMTGWLARSHLDQGRWDEAADAATAVLEHPNASPTSRVTALVVVGRLRARRGDPGTWELLDEALAVARGTGELQRLAPVAAARAEAYWLAGDGEGVRAETEEPLALALEHRDEWSAGELAAWRRHAGIADGVAPERVAAPWALELAGEHEGAAERWLELGCPYEAALALAAATRPEPLRRSVDALQRLGATRAAGRVAGILRSRGVRGVQAGPRASTRANPRGLTDRELDVLGLVAEGLRNREIAARLFVSAKTVDHHVSSILRKLAVETRGQAAAEAARLGLADRRVGL